MALKLCPECSINCKFLERMEIIQANVPKSVENDDDLAAIESAMKEETSLRRKHRVGLCTHINEVTLKLPEFRHPDEKS